MAKYTGVCTPWGEAEGAGQVQPGKEAALGELNSSLPVPKKLVRRWSQAHLKLHSRRMSVILVFIYSINWNKRFFFSMRIVKCWNRTPGDPRNRCPWQFPRSRQSPEQPDLDSVLFVLHWAGDWTRCSLEGPSWIILCFCDSELSRLSLPAHMLRKTSAMFRWH